MPDVGKNKLYFVRHGEGIDNIARKFSYKRVDSSLTARGVLQAQQTAGFLKNKEIKDPAVYSSAMKRAYETGQIIAEKLRCEFIVIEGFHEVNVGDLEDKDFNDENWAVYQGVVSEWFAGNKHAAIPGGEDYFTMWGRMRAGLEQIFLGRSGSNVILAGHAGIFIATLKELCPELDAAWLQNAECYNCSITELDLWTVDGELRGRLIDWANYGHLSEDVLTRIPGIPPRESIQTSGH
jgi:broad specificity phosphatase PhoE